MTTDAEMRAAYDRFLNMIGHNHSGVLYPGAANAFLPLMAISTERAAWPAATALDILIDMLGSFIWLDGTDRATAIADSHQRRETRRQARAHLPARRARMEAGGDSMPSAEEEAVRVRARTLLRLSPKRTEKDFGGLSAARRRRLRPMKASLQIAQDPTADEVLSTDAFGLLMGMLLDQQFPMERAFAGPAKVLERFGSLDPAKIAAAEPDSFADLCSTPPAIHRYGRSMAGRIQAVAAVVVEEYGGNAERIWTEASSGTDLVARIQALPGFGEQKARIFAALIGKQLGVTPKGWADAIGPYAEKGSFRSVADVVDAESLDKVRSFKKEAKAAAKG